MKLAEVAKNEAHNILLRDNEIAHISVGGRIYN